MANHFADVPPARRQRQMVHAGHLFANGADMKIVNCLSQLSRRRPGINPAMAAGLTICASAAYPVVFGGDWAILDE
ncbi:MAG TPA: hypothetical protein VGO59_18755 [Verrucomicrobiae bacterium]|jgi:hypothetical protein